MKPYILIALLFTVALAGCRDGFTKETTTIEGQRAMFLIPHEPARGIVFYHHGMGETFDAPLTDKLKRRLVEAIVNDGWIVASSDASGDNWGNSESTNDYAALYRYADKFQAGKTWVNFGQSMGGPTALLTLRYSTNLRGCFLIYAVANPSNIATGRLASSLVAAYHGRTWNDPLALPTSHFAGMRLRAYASHGDTIVERAANTDPLMAKARATAIEAETVECRGNHGHRSHFQIKDVLGFLRRCDSGG